MLGWERSSAAVRFFRKTPVPEMISYAQNFEDVILHRVFRDRRDGFYVDVGAMDPVLSSVTKFFYDQGWSGINVEPNESFYRRLLEERPRDINLNIALGDRNETKEFHVFEHIGNSTFDQSTCQRYVERGFEAKSKSVRITTLADVCREHVRKDIDFLKIDCEGWEEFVVKGADWDHFRPKVVLIEATEPGTENPSWSSWEPFLIERALYDFVYFDGLNRFYVRRECGDLKRYFQLPPNVFDEIKLYATEFAESSVRALEENRDWQAGQISDAQLSLEQIRVQSSQSLQAKEDELTASRNELQQLETQVIELRQKLLKSRLWVGQLSQELAALKRV